LSWPYKGDKLKIFRKKRGIAADPKPVMGSNYKFYLSDDDALYFKKV